MSSTIGTPDTLTYNIYVKATPEAVFAALTEPDATGMYGYGAPVDIEPRVGGAFRALAGEEMRRHGASEVIADGEVLEFDPPRRFVHTWRILWAEELQTEGFTQIAYDIEPQEEGVTKVTVAHDVGGAAAVAALVSSEAGPGGGWSEILSDLKTFLETGRPLTG